MKRREFSLATASALGLLSFADPVRAQRIAPKSSEYQVLGKAAPVEAPAGKVEVVEFFS